MRETKSTRVLFIILKPLSTLSFRTWLIPDVLITSGTVRCSTFRILKSKFNDSRITEFQVLTDMSHVATSGSYRWLLVAAQMPLIQSHPIIEK